MAQESVSTWCNVRDVSYEIISSLNNLPDTTIEFRLHPNSTHHQIWIDAESGHIQDQTQLQIPSLTTVEIDQQELFDETDRFDQKISQILPPSLHLHPDQLLKLVCEILSKLLNYSSSAFTSAKNKRWRVSVDLHIVTICRSVLVEEEYMVPAAQPVIEALKEETVKSNSDSNCCTICLDDFHAGSCVTRMPCCHVFHHQCIVRWLSYSHYCPECRFEMPTEK